MLISLSQSLLKAMATKPLTREEIVNTEKKLDMPLDDIIKMSKNTTKAKKPHPNKGMKVFNNAARDKAPKVRQYMSSRPFVRQAALAQRRTNFKGNQFPVTTEVARKAAVAPFRNRPFERNVASSSEKARTRTFMVQRQAANGGFAARTSQQQSQQPQRQGDGGAKPRLQTLDSRFANMKEERMKVLSWRNNPVHRNGNSIRPSVPWARGRFAY